MHDDRLQEAADDADNCIYTIVHHHLICQTFGVADARALVVVDAPAVAGQPFELRAHLGGAFEGNPARVVSRSLAEHGEHQSELAVVTVEPRRWEVGSRGETWAFVGPLIAKPLSMKCIYTL